MMMKHKKTRGFTLLEMILSLALLSIVIAAAGSAMVSASQSYALTRKMQEDEYNARLALLSITREIHRGVNGEVEAGPGRLMLTAYDGETTITYELDDTDNMLKRTVDGDDTPVPFVEVELESFTASSDPLDPRRLILRVECRHGLVLETRVAMFRVPEMDDDDEP